MNRIGVTSLRHWSLQNHDEQNFASEDPAESVSARPGLRDIMLGLLMALLLAGSAVTAWFGLQNATGTSRSSALPIYLEVKVHDGRAHPVAGAALFYKEKLIGVTDSFGEWRRFLKLRPGSTLALLVRKSVAGNPIHITKNIAVPITIDSAPRELRVAIVFPEAAKPAELRKLATLPSELSAATPLTIKWVPSLEHKLNGHSVRDFWIRNELLPALVNRAKGLGHTISSNAKTVVTLQHLSHLEKPEFKGLLRIIRKSQDRRLACNFLLNYSDNVEKVQAKIWERLLAGAAGKSYQVEIVGLPRSDFAVYVGGESALVTGQRKWSYMATGTRGYLAIVNKGVILHRRLIRHQAAGRVQLTKNFALRQEKSI